MRKFIYLIVTFVYLTIHSQQALSRDFFIDPNFYGISDGSKSTPFKDLQELVDSDRLQGGDSIFLKPGKYAGLEIRNKVFEPSVKIEAQVKDRTNFPFIRIKNSKGWIIKGLQLGARENVAVEGGHLINIDSKSEQIVIVGNSIKSFQDNSLWGNPESLPTLHSGILGHGANIQIRGNVIQNVNSGISVTGAKTIVSRNIIENFAGDGIRGLGDDSLFQFNTVKNCHVINDNHDDGFQSWSIGKNGRPGQGAVKNVILRGNIFIANETDQNFPKCDMQGIGMFDGMFENWVIENNIVVVDHWHGLSVYGAKNVKILNNTVFDPNRREPGPAWIRISNHKNGTKSQGNLVANNLASSFKFPHGGALQLQNQIIRNPYALFVDPDNHDYRLKEGARAIDAGMEGVGPKVDFYGNPRPSGEKIDVGAAEFQK